jgi:hypothetical protein
MGTPLRVVLRLVSNALDLHVLAGRHSPCQNLRRFAFQRQPKERPRSTVDIAVTSRKRRSQDQRVDGIRQDLDPQPVHRDNVRRSRGTGLFVLKSSRELGVVVRHVDADTKTPKDEEPRQTVEDGIEGSRHHDSWVLCFARSHRDVVGAGDRERRQDQTLQESEEAAQIAFIVQRCERAWIFPVTETIAVAEWVATCNNQFALWPYKEWEAANSPSIVIKV